MTTRFRPSLLALCIFTFVIAVPLPALAASFSFSYVFGSGKALQGTFDGETSTDGDTIRYISNVMATYDDTLVVGGAGGGSASFSGNRLFFSGGAENGSSFRFITGKIIPPGVPYRIAFVTECGVVGAKSDCIRRDEDKPYVASSWSVTQRLPAPVPEPTAAALFGLGTLVVGCALRRK